MTFCKKLNDYIDTLSKILIINQNLISYRFPFIIDRKTNDEIFHMEIK